MGERFVCYAADAAGVGHIVCPIVRTLLDGKFALEDWILQHFPHLEDDVTTAHYSGSKRPLITRHAWLDSLIAHYEALGD